MGTRAGRYKLGARAGKYKLKARVGKYKMEDQSKILLLLPQLLALQSCAEYIGNVPIK